MATHYVQANIPVFLFQEDNTWIMYTPALDVSSSGETKTEVRRNFGEAVQVFLETIYKDGTREKVLFNLGWHKVEGRKLIAPRLTESPANIQRAIPEHLLSRAERIDRRVRIPVGSA
ncbi:MAG: hypothetical protein COB53_01110 [Elusimicrobia bacterium]|nr:MAG: hypothetical protein COB53_01110 [Elusimicrobiota bacterium]